MEQTDTGQLLTEDVDYRDEKGNLLSGYLARPADDDAHPGIVVIQEWWGLNDHIKDVARRLARQHFVTLAPDLYHDRSVDEPDEARKLRMALDQGQAVQEIQRAITFLLQQNYTAGAHVGIVGFCMGGGLALQTAHVDSRLGATVAFYGSPLRPDEARAVRSPVLGLYAAHDHGISLEAVGAMESALNSAGTANEVHIYGDAEHAFFNDTRESYNPEAARDAWLRTVAWFRDRLNI